MRGAFRHDAGLPTATWPATSGRPQSASLRDRHASAQRFRYIAIECSVRLSRAPGSRLSKTWVVTSKHHAWPVRLLMKAADGAISRLSGLISPLLRRYRENSARGLREAAASPVASTSTFIINQPVNLEQWLRVEPPTRPDKPPAAPGGGHWRRAANSFRHRGFRRFRAQLRGYRLSLIKQSTVCSTPINSFLGK